MHQWVIAAFAVIGAFTACGIGGAVFASLLGHWEIPVAGFCAAFAVVAMAYLAAPDRNSLVAKVILGIGSVLAWLVLEPSYYPETYPSLAYQPTHLPFIGTVLGGLIALAVCLLPGRKAGQSETG